MLNIAFFDSIDWDYDVATPLERPLGGSQSALCYLAVELARRGHQVSLVSSTRQPGLKLGVHCVALAQMQTSFFASTFDAVVVLNGPADLCQRLRGHLRPGVPLVLWTQHAADQPAMQSLSQPEIRNGWSAIVCVSDWHARTMIERYGLNPAKVAVLRNAIGPAFEGLFADAAALARDKEGPPVLVYTSTPFRGLDVLMRVFPSIHQAWPDTRLSVYSSMKVYQLQENADPYAPLYQLCRMTPGVSHPGSIPQKELAQALRSAAILAYPNTFAETSCIAVMEAMAAGLVVVTSDLGALPETTMGLAELVPMRNPDKYVVDYQARLNAVLQRRAADPHGFTARLVEQVRVVNERCTWRARAREWEEAIAIWKAAQSASTDMSLEQAHNLIRTHMQAGRLDKAEAVARIILQSMPNDAETHRLMGQLAFTAGHPQAAVSWLQRAVELDPGSLEYKDNLGAVLAALGRTAEAQAIRQRTQALRPDNAESLFEQGRMLHVQGRFADAVEVYRRVLALQPGHADAANNLGHSLQNLDRTDEALAAYQQAVQARPTFPEALYNLGSIYQRLGRLEEARTYLERSIAVNPGFPEAYNNLGNTLQGLGKPELSVDAYHRALKIRPTFAEAHNNLGNGLQSLGRLEEAEASFREALQHMPNKPEIFNNLGFSLLSQGRIDDAVYYYNEALRHDPRLALAQSNLLLALHYRTSVTPEDLKKAHQDFDRNQCAALRETWRPFANSRDPERPLRLGLVSPDFGMHPVGFFMVRILENLPRTHCQVFAYSDRILADDWTRRLVAAVDNWRPTSRHNDVELAEIIRADQIDILVELSGHTAGNRLMAFARKPAPVQMTWMGYVGTVGLRAIDYLIADRFHIPPGEEKHYVEKVLRMPDGYICYDPPPGAPAVGPLPALARGFVTFGSFSNPAKINREVAAAWAAILQRVPGSRLSLQYGGFGDSATRRRYADLFAAAGLPPDRIDMAGKIPQDQVMGRYNEVDIALDPFPYSGGLTTCEALWMGVPVITTPGRTFAGRHSFSHLSNVGLTETIAANRADYVERAAALAQDLPRLAELRAGLRERMARSPLCDGPRFAANLLELLRGAWRSWCRQTP